MMSAGINAMSLHSAVQLVLLMRRTAGLSFGTIHDARQLFSTPLSKSFTVGDFLIYLGQCWQHTISGAAAIQRHESLADELSTAGWSRYACAARALSCFTKACDFRRKCSISLTLVTFQSCAALGRNFVYFTRTSPSTVLFGVHVLSA